MQDSKLQKRAPGKVTKAAPRAVMTHAMTPKSRVGSGRPRIGGIARDARKVGTVVSSNVLSANHEVSNQQASNQQAKGSVLKPRFQRRRRVYARIKQREQQMVNQGIPLRSQRSSASSFARRLLSSVRGSTPLWVLGIILIAAATRVIPHPWNFTAAGAMAFFAGIRVRSRLLSLALVLGLLLATDSILGFYSGMEWVYAANICMTMVGWMFRESSSVRTLSGGFVASAVFFTISNFGVWYSGGLYAHTLEGLKQCFVMALPFFKNQMLGDMIYLSAFLVVEALFFSRRQVLRDI